MGELRITGTEATVGRDPASTVAILDPAVSRTHALLPGSPAIGRGNNVLGLRTDQRGAPFDRVDGASADIGALEFSDTVFSDGLEPPA